jgi:glutathione S-transferase
MYTLYYAPATASMAVHLALLETGAPYELQLLDFEKISRKIPLTCV